ncbi:hypothetical protein ACYOEI_18915, partial [Singulisphaera rosea]
TLVGVIGLIAGVVAYAGWQHNAVLRRHNAALKAEVSRADRFAANAERLRRVAGRHVYASTLRLAGEAVESRRFETAQDLLDSIRNDSGGDAWRGFAWPYLNRLARRELVRLPESETWMHSMSVSQDGHTIACHNSDSAIVIWDVPSERPRCKIAEPGAAYWEPRLTHDGRILVARRESPSMSGGELGIWDATTGTLRAVRNVGEIPPGGRLDLPRTIHFLDRERLVAHVSKAVAGRESVRIWALDFDSKNDRPRVELAGVDAAAFAPEGPFFATRLGNQSRLHDIATGAVAREYPGEFEGGGSMAFSPDGRQLAVASRKDGIVVRDVNQGNIHARYDVRVPIVSLQFDRVGNTLAAVDVDGKVHLCHRTSGEVRVIGSKHSGRQRVQVLLDFSPDGNFLALNSGGDQGELERMYFWDVKSARRLRPMPTSHAAGQPTFVPDGRSLIVNAGPSPRIWHVFPTPDPPQPSGHRATEAWSLAYSADGKILATGADDTGGDPQTIKLWKPNTGELIRGWQAGEGTVASLAISPDGRTLASGHLSDQDSIRLWEIPTGRRLGTLPGHKNWVRTLAFSPDGRMLASAGGHSGDPSEDLFIRLWSVAEKRCLRQMEGHGSSVRSVAFSPNGLTLASAGNEGMVRLWETKTGRTLKIEHNLDPAVALAFAPDGATLAVANQRGILTIRDSATLSVLKTIRHESSEALLDLAFTPDGRSLATCGRSDSIWLWDTLTGEALLSLKGHKGYVSSLAFAPDGSSLASCSHDGEVKLWRTRTGP